MNDLVAERRKQPQDDLTSALLAAELEGESLTPPELASFFVLLVVAGNETTRNAISHGMKALTDFPDQRRKWWADFEGVAPTAIEEIVRWATPVIHFRRTATRDTELVRPEDPRRREGGALVQLGEPRRGRLRPDPTASTSRAPRTSTSASAAPARTTASAPTSRAARCA